jgi:hypothetical protein
MAVIVSLEVLEEMDSRELIFHSHGSKANKSEGLSRPCIYSCVEIWRAADRILKNMTIGV